MRDHLPTMAMALYYPRRVTPDMGPTHIMPFSQYGSVDAEHAHCGEDRLGAGRFEGERAPPSHHAPTMPPPRPPPRLLELENEIAHTEAIRGRVRFR